MDLLRIIWYVESVWPYDIIVTREEFSPVIVELPRYLNQPRPVVQIGYWGGLVVGYPGGLGVEYQVHSNGLKPSQDCKIGGFLGKFSQKEAIVGVCAIWAGMPRRYPKLILPSFY
jgi:hypothetical protein